MILFIDIVISEFLQLTGSEKLLKFWVSLLDRIKHRRGRYVFMFEEERDYSVKPFGSN